MDGHYDSGTSDRGRGDLVRGRHHRALVDALQEYAEDRDGPARPSFLNYVGNWGLVQLVELSTEEQLKQWVTGHIE